MECIAQLLQVPHLLAIVTLDIIAKHQPQILSQSLTHLPLYVQLVHIVLQTPQSQLNAHQEPITITLKKLLYQIV